MRPKNKNFLTNLTILHNVMALEIKKSKRVLNYTDEKREVYVATADRHGVINSDKLAEEIAVDTGGSTDSGNTDTGGDNSGGGETMT